jgi:hypothetical protein
MTRRDAEAIFTRAEQNLIRKRGEAIHLITHIEVLLDTILVQCLIKSSYQKKFYEVLTWEDFRLSFKVRLFGQINLPAELQAKQREIVKTLLDDLLPTRNRYAHRLSLIDVHKGGAVISLLDKNYKTLVITDEDFQAFRGKCDHVTRMLEDVLSGIL